MNVTILLYVETKNAPELSRAELLKLVEELQAVVAALRAENAALKARIAELETALAKARKNSSNSSKPPSSDIVKPPPQGGGGHRQIGAQPGHLLHERAAFPPEKVERRVDHTPQRCPECGGQAQREAAPALVLQQVEWVANAGSGIHRASEAT